MYSSKFKDMKWEVWQGAGLACKHIGGLGACPSENFESGSGFD